MDPIYIIIEEINLDGDTAISLSHVVSPAAQMVISPRHLPPKKQANRKFANVCDECRKKGMLSQVFVTSRLRRPSKSVHCCQLCSGSLWMALSTMFNLTPEIKNALNDVAIDDEGLLGRADKSSPHHWPATNDPYEHNRSHCPYKKHPV